MCLDSGIPARMTVSQALMYKGERAVWECSAGRAASFTRKMLVVTRGAARLDPIPTQRVGTRRKKYNRTLMTQMNMMNADNSIKILLNHNHQRHLRSITLTTE